MSATFVGANRGKRSVALEIESADGQAALRALLATSDVVVHNHPPSVAERIGLTASKVATSNSAAVLCTISAYGPSGCDARRTALDPIIQAASGLSALTGPPDGEPMRCAAPVVDIATGLAAAAACLAALVARARTGSVTHVEVSMFDVALTMQSPLLPLYSLHGEELPRRGTGRSRCSAISSRPPTGSSHWSSGTTRGGTRCAA